MWYKEKHMHASTQERASYVDGDSQIDALSHNPIFDTKCSRHGIFRGGSYLLGGIVLVATAAAQLSMS